MNKLNEKNAITLIALVITIVVLLVLAGVVINLSMGQNGIITKAQTSVDKYKNEQNEENAFLSEVESEMDKYLGEKILAESVKFTPENSNWKVNNVKEALDYLYEH